MAVVEVVLVVLVDIPFVGILVQFRARLVRWETHRDRFLLLQFLHLRIHPPVVLVLHPRIGLLRRLLHENYYYWYHYLAHRDVPRFAAFPSWSERTDLRLDQGGLPKDKAVVVA